MNDRALDLDAVYWQLNTHRFGRRIVHRDAVTSTNDIARQLAESSEPEGSVVCAEEQTAGRGRMERTWVAPPYSSILMSIVLRPSLAFHALGQLGMAFGLGLSDAVRQETGLNALLKWPNDLMINGRKCAGLLAEAVLVGDRIEFAVVGIGVNVNWSPTSLHGAPTPATSVADELGHPVSREPILASVLNHSEEYYHRLSQGESLRNEWSERCVTLHNEVVATTAWGRETGIAEAIDEEGALLVRHVDGSVIALSAADVSLHSS